MTTCPEWEILLSCAHSNQEAVLCRLAFLQALDWDFLLKAAARHGILPQLYRYLQDNRAHGVPQAILIRLQLQSRANSARNYQLLEELAHILTEFQAHEIPAIPYKGPALAAAVYGDLSLRACGDLDILLRPADVLRAKDLLIAESYQPVQQFTGHAEEEQHLETDCEYNFQRARDGMLVELHWRFRPQFFPLPLDMDRLWASARTIKLGGTDALSLAPEDLLLILCVHGAKHCWERLCWISDIAHLLHAYPKLDWAQTWTQAEALGCGRVLLLGVALARELLEAQVPLGSPKKMPAVVASLAAQVKRGLFQTEASKPDPRRRMLFHLRVRDRLQDRLPYVKHHMQRTLKERKR